MANKPFRFSNRWGVDALNLIACPAFNWTLVDERKTMISPCSTHMYFTVPGVGFAENDVLP